VFRGVSWRKAGLGLKSDTTSPRLANREHSEDESGPTVKIVVSLVLLVAGLLAVPGQSGETVGVGEDRPAAAGSSSLAVTVTDKDGTPLDGLQPGDFQLKLDGKTVDVLRAEQGPPLSVILLVEVSHWAIQYHEEVRQAAAQFAAALRPGDELGVGVFGAYTAPLVPLSGDLLEARRKLLSHHFQTVGAQKARLYDGLLAAMESLEDASGHRVIVSFTVAFDWESSGTLEEVLETARQERVSLEFLHHPRPSWWSGGHWRQLLDRIETLTRETGGGLYKISETRSTLQGYQQVLEKLQGSYRLHFEPVPARSRDGVQKVQLKVSRKGARVLGPTRYVDPSWNARAGRASE